MSFEPALKVADVVLYEGYILYPYRASAQKNHARWQFGVLTPRLWGEASAEPWFNQTECLLELRADAVLRLKQRFLQAQSKTVEQRTENGFQPVASLDVDGELHVSWDEGIEREVDFEFAIADLLNGEERRAVEFAGQRAVEAIPGGTGRAVRESWPVAGLLRVSVERFEGPYGLVKLRVQFENSSTWNDPDSGRDVALRHSLIAAHTLLNLDGGNFISLLEPPEWARPAAAACHNERTWPVLIGEDRRDLILSSPIILYDYPAIAPESPGDLYDATEIDEILTLRTMALTEDEKREARATDPRAAAVIDRVDHLPPELLDRLHGTVRYMREMTEPHSAIPPAPAPQSVPWWDPGADASVSPDTDSILIGDVAVARGSRVMLRPGRRRADAHDMFLAGREAMVEAVIFDVDNNVHVAVTMADDPDADLFSSHGRFLYFAPDELEPIAAREAAQ